MKHRNLRIAWSVAWGVVAVLMCALWVRSYTVLQFHSYSHVAIESNRGRLAFYLSDVRPSRTNSVFQSTRRRYFRTEAPAGLLGFSISRSASGSSDGIIIPHWFLVFVSAAFAALPWLRWRFSLRTLLIATTLVAVLLGLIVWASR